MRRLIYSQPRADQPFGATPEANTQTQISEQNGGSARVLLKPSPSLSVT